MIQQFGICRRIARSDIVDRFDQSHAQQVTPQTIDVAASEVGIVGMGHPLGQLFAARAFCGFVIDGERKIGVYNEVGFGVFNVTVFGVNHFLEQRLRPFDCSATDFAFAGCRVVLQFDLRKER